ncbi:hypothetical protein CHS0354_005848 [Potamilus streckersoni]|uniref:HSF-type DNA-binding domain-containing protein n=1 Tax=Potamilus streckersoni TaxID=2493646 RepID=A0AAE0T1E2_9BIVA|nr:hypothetical protein CHS0354_005848 [Potamilus streckersoni]
MKKDSNNMMHSLPDMGVNNVPAFLTKLWTLVEDPSCNHLIAWDPSGLSFHVYDQAGFAKDVLPLYFKHNNIASFIRQLNMYGFRKKIHLDYGAMKSEKDDLEFVHPYFQRDQEHLLEHIKRKVSGSSTVVAVKNEHDQHDLSDVLSDLKALKSKQDSMNTTMESMKKENETLWREIASLRQKHIKQQQIVNKLVQFLVHLVGANRRMPNTKRKIPLMITDSSQVPTASKPPKYSRQLSIEESKQPFYTVESPTQFDFEDKDSGPVIFDVTDMIRDGDVTGVKDINSAAQSTPSKEASVKPPPATPETTYPQSTTPSQDSSPVSVNATSSKEGLGTVVLTLDSADLSKLVDSGLIDSTDTSNSLNLTIDSKLLTDQLDNIQADLDGYRDILGNQFSLDSSTLFNLFTHDTQMPATPDNFLLNDDPLSFITGMPNDPNFITGNELIQYTAPPDMNSILALSTQGQQEEEEENYSLNTPELDLNSDLNDTLSFLNTINTNHLDQNTPQEEVD